MNIQSSEVVLATANTEAILANPTFQKLTRTRSTLAWTLSAIMWVIYFGFILLVAFNKTDGQILSRKVGNGTTSWAIVAGFAILIVTFVLTAIYVAVANSTFDRLTRKLEGDLRS